MLPMCHCSSGLFFVINSTKACSTMGEKHHIILTSVCLFTKCSFKVKYIYQWLAVILNDLTFKIVLSRKINIILRQLWWISYVLSTYFFSTFWQLPCSNSEKSLIFFHISFFPVIVWQHFCCNFHSHVWHTQLGQYFCCCIMMPQVSV